MQLSNYHSHCTFCDGRSNPEDFVRFAVAKGFRAYGFSSHSPLPFETNWNMSAIDMPEYLQEINRLRQKYADRLEIYTGLEIDYLDETYNASIPYFKELPLDYRIGSIHFLPISTELKEANMVCIDGSFRDYGGTITNYAGYTVKIKKAAPGIFYVSDFLGGWYDQRAGYGSAYAMTGYFQLLADNSLVQLSSYVAGWGDSADYCEGATYDPATGTISYVVGYAGIMAFNVILK